MRYEPFVMALGMVLVAVGAAAFDLRLGMAVAGALLIASAVDFRGVRR